MVIKTDRLILRPFAVTDAKEYYALTRDLSIQRFVPYACSDTLEGTIEDINFYYSKGDFIHDFYFIIEEKSSKKVIGALIVTQNADSEFDMSLIIGSQYRGHGFMLEAINGFVSNLHSGCRLIFIVENDNTPSLHLMSHLDVTEVVYTMKGRRKFLLVTC